MSELTYDPNTGQFFNGRRRVGSLDRDGYVIIRFRGKRHGAHRVAWFLTHGYWPTEIDHINGKPDDNRLINLRDGSHRDNMQNRNRPSSNTSGVLGVYPDRGRSKRWRAAIIVYGVRTVLGSFKTKEEAIAARQKAEQQRIAGACTAVEPPSRQPD